MEVAEARVVLGVGPAAGADDVRSAYRDALRRTHPDLGGGDDEVRLVVDAYRTLLGAPDEPLPTPAPAPAVVGTDAVTVEGDTVAAELPAGDLFAMLLEVGDRIGEIAYLDDHAGILEIVVTFEGYGACSIVLTLQGRATGTTEAFCTVVPLGNGPAPPVEEVAELLAVGLRTIAS